MSEQRIALTIAERIVGTVHHLLAATCPKIEVAGSAANTAVPERGVGGRDGVRQDDAGQIRGGGMKRSTYPATCDRCGEDLDEEGTCELCGWNAFDPPDDDEGYFEPDDDDIAVLGEDEPE